MPSDCTEHRDLLPELVEGQLSALQKQRVDQHLNGCDDCADALQQLWQLQAAASRWDDAPVPYWNRRKTFFPEVSWLPNLHWVSSLASVFVLVLVMNEADISTQNGFSISFGNQDVVTEQSLAERLSFLEAQQREQLNQRVSTLSNQQAVATQLVLRTVLEMSREERKEELGTLLAVWDQAQNQRTQQTEESISVLFASQLEDKRNINQLNRMLRQASLEGNTL